MGNRIRSLRSGVDELVSQQVGASFGPLSGPRDSEMQLFFSLSERYFVPVSCFLLFNLSDWGGRSLTAIYMRVSQITRVL